MGVPDLVLIAAPCQDVARCNATRAGAFGRRRIAAMPRRPEWNDGWTGRPQDDHGMGLMRNAGLDWWQDEHGKWWQQHKPTAVAAMAAAAAMPY